LVSLRRLGGFGFSRWYAPSARKQESKLTLVQCSNEYFVRRHKDRDFKVSFRRKFIPAPLSCSDFSCSPFSQNGNVALALNPKPAVVFTSAANAVLLPKAKPGAMGEQFVMSSIRGREVARAQRSMVWLREDSLQALDFGNGLLGVHPPQYPT